MSRQAGSAFGKNVTSAAVIMAKAFATTLTPRSSVSASLILPIPELLAATYLIPATLSTGAAQARAREAVSARLDDSLGSLVLATLDMPMLVIFEARSGSDIPPLPVTLQRSLGASAEQIEAVASAASLIEIRGLYRAGWPPIQQGAARAAAAALAADLGVPVVDTSVPRILDPEAALAALPEGDLAVRLSEWVLVLRSPRPLGLWFTTKGLGRFGLPELQVRNVPPQLARPWTVGLTGLASRLLDLWLAALAEAGVAAFAEIPELIEVTEADVASAYTLTPRGAGLSDTGLSGAGPSCPPGAGCARVQLAFDPATDDSSDSYLTVLPPGDWPASAGEHLAAVCSALLGAPERDVRKVRAGKAMQQAMIRARESLPGVRARYLSGELGPDEQLLLKHKVAAADDHEYVWAYVTSWAEPSRVLASSADDADSDPLIRVGRPIVIDTAAIVDWAIWIDGSGIVEGGWTNDVALSSAD